jgi:citrate synthase
MTTQHSSSAFTPKGASHIATAETDRIVVRGKDLCKDVIGQQSFTSYFLFLLTGVTPNEKLVSLADATMVALAEHGLVPSVQATRMTLAAAPESIQGAVAAGLLGCGPVILGASETAGRLLMEMLQIAETSGESLDKIAMTKLQDFKNKRLALPGFGHPVHKNGDPRATKLIEMARELGVASKHVAAIEALSGQVPTVFGKPFPMNISGAIPAVLLDAGFPAGALKGIPLLARTASLVAHILEEQSRPIGFKLAAAAEEAMTYDGEYPDAEIQKR